jgi:hypothetical protein
MGAPQLRDEPPLFSVEMGLAPSPEGSAPNAASGLRRKPRLYGKLGANSKAYEHRLRLEQNTPRFLHAVLYFIF